MIFLHQTLMWHFTPLSSKIAELHQMFCAPDGAARQMWRSGNQSWPQALCFRLGLWLSFSSSVISFQVSSHVFNASSDLC